ncbi:hypothetical protein GCM10010168_64270 [Actinoplanes ianthinogenes]|uniref:DUF4386 family protein n=1 Tax=Actinoplanes ianthinogenes TaxID=122358 RepID=A0ABM7MA11_9ACTN|nr:hypothetical protein [Actinoplanes ianthinogenes]BCJ48508.1 hypothetical protein Aiant_91650 [Actinoplanes ianthinogenes]GGR36905.1 hypothetical protein GCM10010168_64270 [Actinoplanes ianthinogenes]
MTTIDRLIRAGGVALCAGGVLSAFATVGHDFVDQKTVNPALTAIGTVGIAGGLLLLLGLPAWYAVQARAAGRFGAVSFVLLYLGVAGLQVASQPVYDYLAPALYGRPGNAALAADGALEEVATAYLVYVLVMLVALNLGFLLFGIAMARARVFPRTLSWTIAVAPLAILFLSTVESWMIALLLTVVAGCGLLMATGRVHLGADEQPATIGGAVHTPEAAH